ncbi:hypothetical protein LTR17_024901 [Elasticomyces elasticus]|nr:hypothetical protein LTR17_024901 [Elasticomyces elasticus]
MKRKWIGWREFARVLPRQEHLDPSTSDAQTIDGQVTQTKGELASTKIGRRAVWSSSYLDTPVDVNYMKQSKHIQREQKVGSSGNNCPFFTRLYNYTARQLLTQRHWASKTKDILKYVWKLREDIKQYYGDDELESMDLGPNVLTELSSIDLNKLLVGLEYRYKGIRFEDSEYFERSADGIEDAASYRPSRAKQQAKSSYARRGNS